MSSRGGRPVKINPVDDVHELPTGRVEALYDQNLFRLQIQRERSGAFWFAASLFGISGLVMGICFGAYMMYVSYVGLTPTVRDTLVQGQAITDARETVNGRPSLMSPDSEEQR